MAKALKRVKKMSDVKKGDTVLVQWEAELIKVRNGYSGQPVIDGEYFYASHDDDLNENFKVYKLAKK